MKSDLQSALNIDPKHGDSWSVLAIINADVPGILGGSIEKAVSQFRRDGFVVIENVLNDDQIAALKAGCLEVAGEIIALDENQTGNRDIHSAAQASPEASCIDRNGR